MRKINKLLLVLALVSVFSASSGSAEAYAETKSTASKKLTTTTKKATTKKVTLSRGSGNYLKQGDADKVVEYAKRFLGVKYVFGGTSTSGFDCSGFTMYAYKSANVNLPHMASSQANLGVAVSKDELIPGDLVYFETYKSGISHVGIYIGGGKFIHASSGKGYVTINNLSDDYYTSRYRGATRIIN
jgi:murein DD-endopeptidase / murein LD-carboxypeptidase